MSTPEIGVFLSAARTYRPGTRVLDVDAACAAVRDLGFATVQLGKLSDDLYAPNDTAALADTLRRHGLTACALTMVYDGESYADYASVQRTVGFMPAERVEERVAFSLRCVDTAAALGVPLVTTHVGLIPADEADPAYRQVLDATNRVAAHAAARGVRLALETGQESAAELLAFLDRLDHPAGVNFDGANFVCYRKDEPLAALRALYPRVLGVHVKDYLPPDEGRLIRTCPLGQGAARVDETVAFLLEAGWACPLVLEVYDETDPIGTIATARDHVQARLAATERKPFRVKARRLGLRPGIDPTKLNQLAADLEDEELLRKHAGRLPADLPGTGRDPPDWMKSRRWRSRTAAPCTAPTRTSAASPGSTGETRSGSVTRRRSVVA